MKLKNKFALAQIADFCFSERSFILFTDIITENRQPCDFCLLTNQNCPKTVNIECLCILNTKVYSNFLWILSPPVAKPVTVSSCVCVIISFQQLA